MTETRLLVSDFLGGFLSEVTFESVFKGRIRFPQMGRGNSTNDVTEVEKQSMNLEPRAELGLESVIFYQDVWL